MNESPQCQTGCVHFYGGEIRHHPDCYFYGTSLTKMYTDLQARLEKAEELNRVYESALEFYADRANWQMHGKGLAITWMTQIIDDSDSLDEDGRTYHGGVMAREALAAKTQKE